MSAFLLSEIEILTCFIRFCAFFGVFLLLSFCSDLLLLFLFQAGQGSFVKYLILKLFTGPEGIVGKFLFL